MSRRLLVRPGGECVELLRLRAEAMEITMATPQPSLDPCDVVYAQPPRQPHEAMPIGGGDLVAMMRVTDGIDLHLGKCDAWGFRQVSSTRREAELLSPGHVRIYLSPDPAALTTLVRFEQRLSPRRGLVEATAVTRTGDLCISAWGDPDRNVLVVEIDDGRADRGAVEVELSHWRGDAACFAEQGVIGSREEIVLPAGSPSCLPLAAEEDPIKGRGIELAIAAPEVLDASATVHSYNQFVSLRLGATGPRHYRVLIACEVTLKGEPTGKAVATLRRACGEAAAAARQRHADWWRHFWSKSQVWIEGDADAEYLTRLWHLFYYQKAIASRGAYPCQFNGGAGLFEGDWRDWRLCVVWQNDREHLWPLDAGNHPELAGNLWQRYVNLLPALRRFTFERRKIEGVLLGEWHQWWWSALHGRELTHDPATLGRAGGARRDDPPGYVNHINSSGAELAMQMLDHARHWGDEAFLTRIALPWLAGVCEYYCNMAQRGGDGLEHFFPSNANETWWKVKDTLNDLCAVRLCFAEFIALAASAGGARDRALAARCREVLDRLPDLSTGKWRSHGPEGAPGLTIDRALDVYSPAGDPLEDNTAHNYEHPELYLVFPWSLTGIGAADHGRAVRTFQHRDFPNRWGWSQCGVQAARLGLRDQTAEAILDHARRHQRFPYGGWDNCARTPYRLPDGSRLADTSYLDSAGENATAIQEMLLQSYPLRAYRPIDDAGPAPFGSTVGGAIRLCPAVPARWSGRFQLHAMGGFLIRCEFAGGVAGSLELVSERGNPCRIASPWDAPTVLAWGTDTRILPRGPTLEFPTLAGWTYRLRPQ